MKVAVWDTYVKTSNGNVLHFDIVVPEQMKDAFVIYGYGKQYLTQLGIAGLDLAANECKFCHIEELTVPMKKSIDTTGFYIIEMETIPAQLCKDAGRREKILFLRAHLPGMRFSKLSQVDEVGLDLLLKQHVQ